MFLFTLLVDSFFYLKVCIMNINTNYLVRGFSALFSQLEVSQKNTLLLLKKVLLAKNTGETKNNKNNELNEVNVSKKNLPTLLVENHSLGIAAQDRFTNKMLKITRYHPPSSEHHHDLAQLLAQPLSEFQLSPTEAYNKWVVTPAIPKLGSKISPTLLHTAPLPPTPVQKRLMITHQHASVIRELNAVLAKRKAVNVEPPVAHLPAREHKQPPAPLIRAQSLPTTTHQPVSLMSELNAVLAKRNAANTNGHQSNALLTFMPQQIKDPPVYVKEFNEIF